WPEQLWFRRRLPRVDVEGQFVDLAGELEWHIVAIVHERQRGTGVLSDIEGLVLREGDRSGVLHGIPGHFLAVHGQHARAARAQTETFRLEVKNDRVLARLQLRPF